MPSRDRTPPPRQGVAAAREQPRGAPARALRVVVMDDHPLYREGIVRALEDAGWEVAGDVGDGERGLAMLREQRPDVALVDVSMPLLDGIGVVAAIARNGPDVPVVLLSAFDDEPLVVAGLQAGAAAYMTKDADRAAILQCAVAAADPALAPSALAVDADVHRGGGDSRMPLLSWQERRLLQLARIERDDSRVSLMLGIEEPAVRRGLSRAIAKLGAGTLPEALEVALRTGLIR
jgi:two-component system nitrate/nitrite response regulator NarL